MTSPKNFKTPKAEIRAQYLHPFVQQVMGEMIDWLEEKGVEAVITDTVTTLKEDAAVKRRSVSHREGRAFDLRTRDWPRGLILDFKIHFLKKYSKEGALSASTLEPNLLVHHDSGFGEHFHVQFGIKYAVKMPLVMEPQDPPALKVEKKA